MSNKVDAYTLIKIKKLVNEILSLSETQRYYFFHELEEYFCLNCGFLLNPTKQCFCHVSTPE